MSKKVVKISSHGLSDYQQCPRRFWYSIVRKLKPRMTYRAFDRGTVIALLMEEYYSAKIGRILDNEFIMKLMEKRIDKSELSDEDKMLIGRVFLQYVHHYCKEDWKPLATELPFTIKLYEDDKYLFIYEGTIDLVIVKPHKEDQVIIVDHKSYSVFTDIYQLNNQAMGYCNAMKTDTMIYNYIGLTQTKKPADNFQRKVKVYYKQQLEAWKKETILWFKKIADDENYQLSYQCVSKYGKCKMHELCESPFEATREQLINIKFQRNEFASWGKEKEVSKEESDETYSGA